MPTPQNGQTHSSNCLSVFDHFGRLALKRYQPCDHFLIALLWGDHSFSALAKFSEKLIFLTPWYAHTHTCAYQGVRNVSFSKNFANVLNEWPKLLEAIVKKMGERCIRNELVWKLFYIRSQLVSIVVFFFRLAWASLD